MRQLPEGGAVACSAGGRSAGALAVGLLQLCVALLQIRQPGMQRLHLHKPARERAGEPGLQCRLLLS